jgi:hypothetical protein
MAKKNAVQRQSGKSTLQQSVNRTGQPSSGKKFSLFQFPMLRGRQRAVKEAASLPATRFSNPLISWAPVSEFEVLRDARSIVASLTGETANPKVFESTEPDDKHRTFRVDVNSQSYLFKLCTQRERPEHLALQHHILRHARRGGSHVPGILPISSVHQRVDSRFGLGQWLALDYIPAQSYFSGDGMQIWYAANELAVLHMSLQGYQSRSFYAEAQELSTRPTRYSGLPMASALQRGIDFVMREAQAHSGVNPTAYRTVDKSYVSLGESIRYYAALSPLARGVSGETQFIHGNIHPHNVLCVDRQSIWFCGLQGLRLGSVYEDVGRATYELVRHAAYEASFLDGPPTPARLGLLGDFFQRGYLAKNTTFQWHPEAILAHALHGSLTRAGQLIERIFISGKEVDEREISRVLNEPADLLAVLRPALHFT